MKLARYHPAARDELRAAIRYGEADRPGRVRRHPYLVVYAIRPDQLVIIAIAHTSKQPGYWRDRVADLVR